MAFIKVLEDLSARILRGRVRQGEVDASTSDGDRIVITVTAEQLVLAAWREGGSSRGTITNPSLDTITINSPFGSYKFTSDEVLNILARARLRGKL